MLCMRGWKRKAQKVFDIWSKRIFWELTPREEEEEKKKQKEGVGGGKLISSLIDGASLGDEKR